MRPAKGRAREPGKDLAPAYREKAPYQREPLASRLLVEGLPIQHGGLKRQGIQRVGNLVAIFRINACEFPAPAVAYGLREVALEVAEEREWCFRAPFLAHEQHRDRRRRQGNRQRCFDSARPHIAFEPVAERTIADLIVVLQEVDEGGGSELAARLAAQSSAAMHGGFALIDKAGPECTC